MADERDDIRARIDLVDLVGQRVALKRAGKNWKGLCPFHDDRNPSFVVSPDIGYYRCWSCGEKGDAFTWVMKTQNLTFVEALEQLARQAGVTLRPRTGEVSKTEADQRAAAMDDALRFFREALGKSPQAIAYCESRGITENVRETWEIGYAPDVKEALAIHLKKKGHSLALCQSLFLVDQDPYGGFFGKFHGRLMFPIRDERGQLVAFGGRILGEGHPKYINSGDTPIFRKSRVLYGLYRAKQKLLESRRAVLVEGYLDVIACHRAGVEEAVASLGTAFAEDHAKLLKRWCGKVAVLYDGDEAGQKAAERACEILRTAGLQASVALVPPGDDPDTLLGREGPHAVKLAAGGGISPLAFTLRRLEQREDPQEPTFWSEAVAALAASDSPAEVDRHVTELAAKFMAGQPESTARATLYSRIKDHRRQLRRGPDARSRAAWQTPIRTGLASQETLIFGAFLEDGLRKRSWDAIHEPGLLWTNAACGLAEALRTAFQEAPSGLPKLWIGKIPDEEARSLLAEIPFSLGYRIGGKRVEDTVTSEALDMAIVSLRKMRDMRLTSVIKDSAGDDESLKRLQEHIANLKGRHEYTPEQKERRVRS